jgi:hypothetical protein
MAVGAKSKDSSFYSENTNAEDYLRSLRNIVSSLDDPEIPGQWWNLADAMIENDPDSNESNDQTQEYQEMVTPKQSRWND